MRYYILAAATLLLAGTVTFYGMGGISKAELTETVKVKEEQENFVIHLRVEEKEGGFQILCALENKGEKAIDISHRTPLISVTIDRENHDFTGKPVAKTMEPDDIYHPQDPLFFSALPKGSHTLFIKGEFLADGRVISIETTEEITFQ